MKNRGIRMSSLLTLSNLAIVLLICPARFFSLRGLTSSSSSEPPGRTASAP